MFAEHYNHYENTSLPSYFCRICHTLHAQARLLLLQTLLSCAFPLPYHLCLDFRYLSLYRHGDRISTQIQTNQRAPTNEVLPLDVTGNVSLLCFSARSCNIQLISIWKDSRVHADRLHLLFWLSPVLLHPLLPNRTTKVLQQ